MGEFLTVPGGSERLDAALEAIDLTLATHDRTWTNALRLLDRDAPDWAAYVRAVRNGSVRLPLRGKKGPRKLLVSNSAEVKKNREAEADAEPEVTLPGPCARCGRNPAAGFASVWTQATGERWFCHGDDEEPTCYESGPA